MDDVLKITETEDSRLMTAATVLFALLAVLLFVSAYTSMTLAEGSALVRDLNFYDRYSPHVSVTDLSSLVSAFTDVLINSVPSLVQLTALFLLSFSPLLIPAGVVLTILRGILSGIALCKAGGTPDVIQPCFYLAVSLIVCFTCSSLLRCRKDGCTGSRVLRMTAIFLISSGASVTAEIVLSLLI